MRPKAAVIAGLIILIGFAAIVITHKTAGPGQHEETTVFHPGTGAIRAADSTDTITYSGGLFRPPVLAVKPGTTVHFVSSGSPVHILSDKPLIDTGTAVSSYSFTFPTVGSWGYYNAADPTQAGIVEVLP